jgi:hypothetical protein
MRVFHHRIFRALVFYPTLVGILLFLPSTSALPHASSSKLADANLVLPSEPPDQFVRDVLAHEVEAQSQDHSLWCFHELKTEDGAQKLLHVCQTQEGQIERLISLNGHPLTVKQATDEDRRIVSLLHDPAEIKARRKKDREDGEQARKLLKLFPEAFHYRYDGFAGNFVRLKFVPNPQFHPSGHSEQVFHHMEGTLLLDPAQKRLTEMDGRLTSEVKFLGGLLGHLDKGGTFSVKQQDVGCHCWAVTLMDIHMSGRALFLKTISVRTFEQYTDFRPSPSGLLLAQAAELVKAGSDSAAGNSGACRVGVGGS